MSRKASFFWFVAAQHRTSCKYSTFALLHSENLLQVPWVLPPLNWARELMVVFVQILLQCMENVLLLISVPCCLFLNEWLHHVTYTDAFKCVRKWREPPSEASDTLFSPTDRHRKHTESRTEDSDKLNMQRCKSRHKQREQTGSTFSETAVVSQASGKNTVHPFRKKKPSARWLQGHIYTLLEVSFKESPCVRRCISWPAQSLLQRTDS